MNQPLTAAPGKVSCSQCKWLRVAPWQAKKTGCYHPDLMPAKQKDRVLDEQQIPGDHEVINRRGDCPKYEPKAKRPSFWQRVFS